MYIYTPEQRVLIKLLEDDWEIELGNPAAFEDLR